MTTLTPKEQQARIEAARFIDSRNGEYTIRDWKMRTRAHLLIQRFTAEEIDQAIKYLFK